MFTLNIDKQLNSLSYNIGGANPIVTTFLDFALERLVREIDIMGEIVFYPSEDGNFFTNITGKNEKVIIQRFRSTGLKKDEILHIIYLVSKEFGIRQTHQLMDSYYKRDAE